MMRTLLTATLLCLPAAALAGVTPGDTCANPIPLDCGDSVTVDLAGYSDSFSDPPFSCRAGGTGNGAASAWFSFIAPSTVVQLSTCGSAGSDSLLGVYQVGMAGSPCPQLTEIACNDDSCGSSGWLSSVYVDGLTPGQTYFVQMAAWDFSVIDAYTISLACFDCPLLPEGTTEAETTCADGYMDMTNAGCDSDPPSFIDVACGETITGASGAFFAPGGLRARDTDVFRITLAEPALLSWSVSTEFPALIGILNTSGPTPCPVDTFLPNASALVGPCETAAVSAAVAAGTWYLYVSPDDFTGTACGRRYIARVGACATGACCVGGACAVQTPAACTVAGGVYLGDGSGCMAGTCGAPCAGAVRGDSNCDDAVNFDDIECFIAGLIAPSAWDSCGHGDGCDYLCQNDTDGSGSVDFDDIESFVVCLIGSGCP